MKVTIAPAALLIVGGLLAVIGVYLVAGLGWAAIAAGGFVAYLGILAARGAALNG